MCRGHSDWLSLWEQHLLRSSSAAPGTSNYGELRPTFSCSIGICDVWFIWKPKHIRGSKSCLKSFNVTWSNALMEFTETLITTAPPWVEEIVTHFRGVTTISQLARTHVDNPSGTRTDSPEHLYNPEFQHPIIMMFLDYNKNYSGICGLGAIDANFGGRFNTRVYRVEIRCTGCDWRSCKIFSCSSQSLSKFACKPILWLVQYGHH